LSGALEMAPPRAGITVEARCEQLGCSLNAIDVTGTVGAAFLADEVGANSLQRDPGSVPVTVLI
jgi:hypothetical protein